jgi:hypothetical protein
MNKRYILLDSNNKVKAERYGPTIVEGEIESEIGEVGQIMQDDGTFIDDLTPIEQPPSRMDLMQEQIDQLTIMLGDALLEGGI